MPSCINCSQVVSTPYCGACGQKTAVKKLSWRALWNDLHDRWLGFDNKLLRTCRDLLLRPEDVVQAFLRGNRVRYLGPLGFFITMGALSLIFFGVLNVSVEEFLKASQSFQQGLTDKPNAEQQQWVDLMVKKLSNYFRFLPILLSPFFALATRWLYRRSQLGFLEHIVIYIYLISLSMGMVPLQITYFKFGGSTLFGWSILLTLALSAYFNARVFGNMPPRLVDYLKGAGAYLLGFGFYILFISLVILLVGLTLLILKNTGII